MIFSDTINGTTIISYVTCDRVHSAPLAAIEAACDEVNEVEPKPGPHPFFGITVEVDLVRWASTSHAPLVDLSDAIDEWCSWIDEVCELAADRGDDSTAEAREMHGYLFSDEIADVYDGAANDPPHARVSTLHDAVTTAIEVIQ